MSLLNVIPRRLRALFQRPTVETEMDQELRLHFELAVKEGLRRGLTQEEAHVAALREFRGMDVVKEAYRNARGVRVIEELVQDLRFGLRSLRKAPTFTTVVILTLGLGIGANTAIFSVVNAVLLRSLPYTDPDRVTVVWETDRASGTTREGASVPDYYDFVARARSFASLAAMREVQANRTAAAEDPERLAAALVTASFFGTLGVEPIAGRVFTVAEDVPGGPRAAVLSERYWRSRLDADPAAIGRTLRLDDSLYTIVGVVAAGVSVPTEKTDLWLPMQLTPETTPRSMHSITVIGRLLPGVTVAAAQGEMATIARQLEAEYPRENENRGVNIEPLREVLVGEIRPALVVLLGAVGLVLLIACANAANLLLARFAARAREVAVRSALGASARRLAQQFFVESLLLTVGAALFGIGLAVAGLNALVRIAPANLPRLGEVSIDLTVLAVTLGVSVLVAMSFGLLPSGAGRSLALREVLQGGESRSATASRRHRRFRSGLVVAEIAISLVLAVGAGLLIQSFRLLRGVDPGFTTRNILKLHYQLPRSRYPQSFENYPSGFAKILTFQDRLLEGVAAVPGVRSVAIAASDPLTAGFTNGFVIEGHEAEAENGQAELATRPVSPSYFQTVGVRLLKGRAFASTDHGQSPPVVIINDAAARKYLPNADPIGKRIRFWGISREIVGVVSNERFAGLAVNAPPAMYPPITQTPMSTAAVLVRTDADPRLVLGEVRAIIRGLDRDLAPYDVATLDEALAASIAQKRFLTLLLGVFAAVALLLALVGVYGVVSYTVAQRTHEIGVRVALGATGSDVVRYIVGHGVRMALLGILIGVFGALVSGNLLATQLYGVTATDPAIYAIVITATLLVVTLASYLPARRAARITPLVALRES